MKKIINSLNDYFSYSFSLDCVIFGYQKGKIHVLLIERNIEPFKSFWAIPGDLIKKDEDLPQAADRILYDLTSLRNVDLHQTQTYGKPDRHPLGRVITCAYMALVSIDELDVQPSSWAVNVKWQPVNEIQDLAFDHNYIVSDSFLRLKEKLQNEPVCFSLLPEKFSLNDIQALYEYAFDTEYDKANFRKKIKNIPLIDSGERQKNVRHRPAKLYSFDQERYKELFNTETYRFKM